GGGTGQCGGEAIGMSRAVRVFKRCSEKGDVPPLWVSEGGLEPPCPIRALAPQASASAYSATRTQRRGRTHIGCLTLANPAPTSEVLRRTTSRVQSCRTARIAAKRRRARRTASTPPVHRPAPGPRPRCPPACDDSPVTENQMTAQDEVVDICRDLIMIDTSNPGDHSGPGERLAAEHVAALLTEAGLEPKILESHPKPASAVPRIEGADRTNPGLLIHGHLDVVPANADDWRRHPFSGDIAEECVWGRGAVDMKDMDAMILAVVRQRLREQRKPARDVVLAFTADEEAGGTWGASYLVDNHAGLFEGVTEAIGEVGGFSTTVAGQRLYLMQTAEKGMAWLRLTARGTAGHGSMIQPDNAVTELAEAVARIGRHEWPTRLIPSVRGFLEGVCDVLTIDFNPNDPAESLGKI